MSRLRFHECLGRGGYGEVYRATWERKTGHEMEVAVKVLNARVASGSSAQKRLRDEARLLGALTHPGIVRVYDLVELGGVVAMLCEFVDGADLDRCVLEGLPTGALVEVVGRVASALAAAWGDISPVSGKPLRLVHRDVKPENIRVTPHGEVKLLDFGVARAAELQRESETASNTVLGSYRYMSPERFDAGLQPHPSMDVFALGCILYEGVAFRRLFEHLSAREMLVLSLPGTDRYERYIEERLGELPSGVHPDLKSFIRRLVSRDPSNRPLPGRLAALCDDLVDELGGTSLSSWCRNREWIRPPSHQGPWVDTSIEIESSAESQAAASAFGDVPTEPVHDLDEEEDHTLASLDNVRPVLSAPPSFGPPDLKHGRDDAADPRPIRQPTPPPTPPRASSSRGALPTPEPAPPSRPGAHIPEDQTVQQPHSVVWADSQRDVVPTVPPYRGPLPLAVTESDLDEPSQPPPTDYEETATETLDLAQLRANLEAERSRRAQTTEETDPPAPAGADTHKQHVPDDLFDVPLRGPDGPELDIDDSEETERQVPEPDASTTPRAPEGPEKYKSSKSPAPPRKRSGANATNAVLANIAVLAVLLLLGGVLLIAWVVAF